MEFFLRCQQYNSVTTNLEKHMQYLHINLLLHDMKAQLQP
jgi:hypothetical protein